MRCLASAVLASALAASTATAEPRYAGAATCAPCHPTQHGPWAAAPHSRTVRAPSEAERASLAESLLCADEEVVLVVGIRRHLRFVSPPDAGGAARLLPCRWNRDDSSWEVLGNDPTAPGVAWREVCAPCHDTGVGSLDEHGVGCEACHGPAAAHAASPTTDKPFAFPADQPGRAASVCGSCHLQGGESPAGKPFPEGFRPGRLLGPSYRFPWEMLEGDPGDRHAELDLRARLVDGSSTRPCLECHDPHDQSADRHRALERTAICDQCHVAGGLELRPDRETECPVCRL